MFEQTIWALIITAFDNPLLNEWMDQYLHTVWIVVCMLPILIKRNMFTFTLAGFLFCLPRELIDQGALFQGKMFGIGKVIDIAFFTLGGAISGYLYEFTNPKPTQQTTEDKDLCISQSHFRSSIQIPYDTENVTRSPHHI